jgi:hypothetical protein
MNGTQSAVREAAPWVRALARAGYAARGIIYLMIAFIAGRTAFHRDQPADMREAMNRVDDQPGGKWMLIALAVGFAGFALWRLAQAALDPEGKGRDSKWKGAAHRVRYLGGAAIHIGLAYSAARLAWDLGQSGNRSWYQAALSPVGRIVMLCAAAGCVGFGIFQLIRSYKVKLDDQLDLSSLGAESRRFVIRAGRAGLAARGVVFLMIGYLVFRLARYHSDEAPGIAGALRKIRDAPYGTYLLAAIAVGLAGYGAFELTRARYRRINPT